jgi:hypothetical protein
LRLVNSPYVNQRAGNPHLVLQCFVFRQTLLEVVQRPQVIALEQIKKSDVTHRLSDPCLVFQRFMYRQALQGMI